MPMMIVTVMQAQPHAHAMLPPVTRTAVIVESAGLVNDTDSMDSVNLNYIKIAGVCWTKYG